MFSHLYLAIYVLTLVITSTQPSDKCEKCRQIVSDFNRGVEETKNNAFQGGDVVWEEEKLKVYANSELRLVEILERVCDSRDIGCLSILEDSEDLLEEWWQGGISVDLFEWFCVDKVRLCCPTGTYGPDCSPCRKWHGLVCSGHGQCVGDGTRGGDGTCHCENGYTSNTCSECSRDYFQIGHNETLSCVVCDTKCVSCDGPGASGCMACRNGFKMVDGSCEDVNECESVHPCDGEDDCYNNDGSYECRPPPATRDVEVEESTKAEL